ncbi:DUF721 domain-containing protein [Streptomyces luteireticuli]|uniref:DUF721 domain-containing protein n=1 Tax=Streptomyces luteireticuli TaxID=173858 RepID=UPI003555EFEF
MSTPASSAPSGIDLARVALKAARDAARKTSATVRKPPPRNRTARRRDGRDPLNLAAAFAGLIADRAWELPTEGASVLTRWPDLFPDLAANVAAVAYHPDRGQLDLLPASPSHAAQARILAPRLVEYLQAQTDTSAVRAIRVLAPGAVPQPVPQPSRPAAPTAAPAVKTRQDASPGYHQALAALHESTPQRTADPAVQAAVQRQNRSLPREPEYAFARDLALRQARPSSTAVDDTRARALARARAERSSGKAA